MLSAAQRERFDRDGFLVVEDVLGPEILDPVRAEYAALLEGLMTGWGLPLKGSFADRIMAAYERGLDWFQPMDISLPGDRVAADTPFHFGPAVFDMLTAPALLDLMESMIGPELTSNPIQHVRIKPPARRLQADEIRAHVGGTDWHQDRGVAHAEADQTDMITVWVAVTDATVENGCLQAVPKDDGQGMLPHCPMRQTGIAPGFLDESHAVPLPVRAGGVVLLHPLTPHASLPNNSDGIRWSFDLRYNVTGQPTGRSHFPSFVARSRSQPETALRDWRKWKAMWEEARAELAGQPHVEIHRWKSDAPYCA